MEYCTQCGHKLEFGQAFCTNCGTRPENQANSMPNSSIKLKEERSIVRKNNILTNKKTKVVTFSIIGMVLLFVIAYFVVNALKEPEMAVESSSEKSNEEGPNPHLDDEEENGEKIANNDEEVMLERYTKQLERLRIVSEGQDITVGDWDINHNNNTLYFEAKNIPSEDLESIFSLYDDGDIDPTNTWAKEVVSIVEELAGELHTDWNIEVGNNCVTQYPNKFSSSDLMDYSGSCGYSIPVLTGSDKASLALIVNEEVFSSPASADSESNNETSSGTEADNASEVGSFIKKYIEASVTAINRKDFSLVEPYIDPSGKTYKEQKEYTTHLNKKNITEELMNLEVEKISKVDESTYEVATYAAYKIIGSDSSIQYKNFNSVHKVKFLEDGELAVNELLSSTEVKRD